MMLVRRLRVNSVLGMMVVKVPKTSTRSKLPKFSTSSNQDGYISKLIQETNASFINHPMESIGSLILCELLSINVVHALILGLGIPTPGSLALGFAVSRPFRRLRMPLDLAMASLLARLFPRLTEVRLVTLFANLLPPRSERVGLLASIRNWKGAQQVREIADKYGACYFIGARWMGAVSVFFFTSLIQWGVDITPILEQFGISQNVQSTFGSWALAVTLSSVLYPATMALGAVVLAPRLHRFRVQQRIKNKL